MNGVTISGRVIRTVAQEQRIAGRALQMPVRALDCPRHGKRSEGETSTDCRSNVVVVVIGDAGAVRNGDGETTADVGIRNADISVERLGEVMIHIERTLVEVARARSPETRSG
jgi:hypothetical protein